MGVRTRVSAVRVAVEGEQELSVPRAVRAPDLARLANILRVAPFGLGAENGTSRIRAGSMTLCAERMCQLRPYQTQARDGRSHGRLHVLGSSSGFTHPIN